MFPDPFSRVIFNLLPTNSSARENKFNYLSPTPAVTEYPLSITINFAVICGDNRDSKYLNPKKPRERFMDCPSVILLTPSDNSVIDAGLDQFLTIYFYL